MTKISIVTTCFNAEATIAETIESIMNQKGDFEVEHIITDAGSKDKTVEIIRSYGDAVILYETPGLNQSEGINFGLKKASGSIMAFLNADDVYYPDTFSSVIKGFESHPESRWLVGYCPIIDEHGVEQSSWISSYKNFWLRHYSYFWLLVENFICQPAVFFRKETFEKFGYFKETEQYCMDYEFWLKIGATESPVIVEKPLAKFRRMSTTKSNTGFEKQFLDDKRLGVAYALENKYMLPVLLKTLSYWRTIVLYRRMYVAR